MGWKYCLPIGFLSSILVKLKLLHYLVRTFVTSIELNKKKIKLKL